MGFAEGRYGSELEGSEGLAPGQSCLGKVPRDASGGAIGKLIGRHWEGFASRADLEGWGAARYLAALCEQSVRTG